MMTNLSRRSLLVAMPAVILTPGLLMPVKAWQEVVETRAWRFLGYYYEVQFTENDVDVIDKTDWVPGDIFGITLHNGNLL